MSNQAQNVSTSWRVWLRRLIVWSVTLGLLSWAGVSCFRVLIPKQPSLEVTESEQVVSELPSPAEKNEFEEVQKLMRTTQKLMRAGDLEGGLSGLKQIVKQYKDTPQARQALLTLAATYRYNLNQPKQAINTYSQFVKDYPDDRQLTKVIEYLRELYKQTGQPDRTDLLLRGLLVQLEDQPEVKEKILKLLQAN